MFWEKIKILVKAEKDDIWEEALKPLYESDYPVEVYFATSGSDIEKIIEDVDVIVGGNLRQEQLEKAKKLKLIQYYWAGVERINFDYLKKRGRLIVCNSHENRVGVAEYTWGLILTMVKKINLRERLFREGKWLRGYKRELLNVELRGKCLGILGLGSIGREIARLGNAFGMKVIGTQRNPVKGTHEIEEVYPPEKTKEVCLNSDITVVSLPLTKETEGLVGWDILKDMRGKYIVNVARGPVIEEEALFKALKEGILAGAAIDTWYNYPKHYGDLSEIVYPSRYPFDKLDNVVMSPHAAGFSLEGHIRNTKEAVLNVIRFINGEELKNVVDLEAGY